jgi:hypothetical protein
MQGAAPGSAPKADPPTPVLFDDIQAVYLARLYPEAVNSGIGAARTAALDAGNAARSDGMALLASQQEPIATTEAEAADMRGREPPPPPPPHRHGDTKAS